MFVYVIGPNLGPQKIGIASDPQARLASMQTGCPFTLRVHFTRETKSLGHARSAERMAHRLLHKSRQRGEWFNVTPERAIEAVMASVGSAPDISSKTEDVPAALLAADAITWGQYEAALAYRQVRSKAMRGGYATGTSLAKTERYRMAAAIVAKIEGEIIRRHDSRALRVLLHVVMRDEAPNAEELFHLRNALNVVSQLLDDATSAKAA